MEKNLRKDAETIIKESIREVMPDKAVKRALTGKTFDKGKIYLVAVGKAAWQMAKTASDCLGDRIESGIVITKYGHVQGSLHRIECCEAGHPVPDQNSFAGTEKVLRLTGSLDPHDTVLFLVSGGGSALFEKPLCSGEELTGITKQLLSCGADIVEINTVRKRLSAVKGGRFARLCEPAHVYSIILSDILKDPLDMIASGPAYPDSATCADALAIAEKYHLIMKPETWRLFQTETPKTLSNVETIVTGSVRELCRATAQSCRRLGYEPVILTDQLCCEAREAGSFLAAIAGSWQNTEKSLAFIAGGETVVHVTGNGMGGRNQEIVLAAAQGIAGLESTAVFSLGSDGTDGPTDAAGGYCDGDTKRMLEEAGTDIFQALQQNDSYHALQKCNGLLITGPTGTNVNDVSVVLISRVPADRVKT